MKAKIREVFRDPIKLCTYVLGFKPTKYQEDLARKFVKHQFITTRWCRQSGKSHMISRVIIHPKYRSVGLGSRLVRETLPLVGRKYIETMAVMARYNPFFEKAGMTRIA
ncbi:hypothetical protein J7L18_00140 [Candidatus Bathyarchaeota archaeon]|nr:hypothetical protein [Candidatus Bathyarchaeota archaeon]